MKKLPPHVLAFFKEQGAKGGRIGGKRSLETMTAEQRAARAREASKAAAEARKAKAKKAKLERRRPQAQLNAMQNHSEIAEFLWRIADLIKDDYDAKDYEDVILPFTFLRRLDCVLEPTREIVRTAAVKYKATPEQTRDTLLKKAAVQSFYNTSEYSLVGLLKFPNDMGANFSAYLEGFSANVKDILLNFSSGEEKGLAPKGTPLAAARVPIEQGRWWRSTSQSR